MKSAWQQARETSGAYLELTKPRITALVVCTTAAGFYLAGSSPFDGWELLHALLGTGMVAGGTSVLNQVLERENDGRMRRTASRPLPSERAETLPAATFGLLLIVLATAYLAVMVNVLTAFLGFLTAAIYLLIYTPLKTRSSLCTTVGAVPGAIPPLMGWAAARGHLDAEAWLLFLILFLWQFPHFLAIAWVYREDYQRGGFRMLPLTDTDGTRTARRVVISNLALLVMSAIPTLVGLTGISYLAGAVLLGGVFLWFGYFLARTRSLRSARYLLRASVLYLPLLLVLMVVDKA